MRALILTTSFLLSFCFCFSQQDSQFDKNLKYYYPGFQIGSIHFKNGKKADSKLNYDLLNEEMHFIGKSGDTLALNNMNEVRIIIIGSDQFYYNNGFLKVITELNAIKLASKQKRSAEVVGLKGAYGERLDGSAIANYNNLLTNDYAAIKLKTGQVGYGNLSLEYYISGPENNFIIANKKNLTKLMPDQKDALNEFLKKHQIDFSNQTDLIKLLTYFHERD
jgi:hypothetical protein